MKYFSTFTGIGGFELGIIQAHELSQMGAEPENSTNDTSRTPQHTERPLCVGYSEIDKYAVQIYQRHFPNHKNYGDITKINSEELPDFDLLVGGFPCQAFSIAGKRGGFEDTRGTLFFDLARILRAKKPRLFVFENVKGLLSHNNGNTFKTIISTLDELGYDTQWQVLNSKNFGVPQNRERVFIVGHLRGTSRPEVFPIRGTNNQNSKSRPKALKRDTGQARIRDVSDISDTVTGGWGESRNNATFIVQLNNPIHSNDRVYGTDGVSPTLNTMQGGNRQPFIPEDSKIRRLTPTECERLQGFPDGWTEGVSDTQRYKCCGNAVTVNVVRSVMEKLL